MACRKVGSPLKRPGDAEQQRLDDRCRKVKRISESELRGTVNYDLVALLTRGGASSRVVGPSIRVVHGEQQARRSSKQDPSWPHVIPSELGHAVRRSATARRDGGADRPDYIRRDNRCVAGSKG